MSFWSLISLFGGRFIVLNLILLAILFIYLKYKINRFSHNKITRYIFDFTITTLFFLQLASAFILNEFIGYEFYIHFNISDIKGMAHFWYSEIFIFLLFYSIVLFILLKFDQILKLIKSYFIKIKLDIIYYLKKNKLLIKVMFFSISFFIMCSVGNWGKKGVLLKTSELFSLLMVPKNNVDFSESLINLNINNYPTAETLSVNQKIKKNIILISLESFDKSYIEDEFLHLTPNLSNLRKKWNFYEINPNLGSNWTSGSLYTLITGVPSFFGRNHNNIFQNSISSKIIGLSHILKKANYELLYFIGKANYSGTLSMLKVFNFDKVIDHNSIGSERDLDLFNAVKKEIKKQKELKKPYAIFISTVDTHSPNGYYDSRMEKFVNQKKSDLEFMISSTDYLIGDLISYLNENNINDSTSIFIFPDHLFRGKQNFIPEQKEGERGLFLMTNELNNKADALKNHDLFQIDLPKIILKNVNIEHNSKFLTDHIVGNKSLFIRDNMDLIKSLNNSSFRTLNTSSMVSDNYKIYKKDITRFIAHAGGEINNDIYTNSLEALDLNYSRGFRFFELDILKTYDNELVAVHNWKEWAEKSNYSGPIPPTKNQFLKYNIDEQYTPLDMDLINKWFMEHDDAILITDKVNDVNLMMEKFYFKERLQMELYSLESLNEAIKNEVDVLLSHHVFFQLGEDRINILKNLNIDKVTFSRHNLYKKKKILEDLKKNKIKVFIYHVNEKIEDYVYFNEDYVVKYEMDNIYGIYADKWIFE